MQRVPSAVIFAIMVMAATTRKYAEPANSDQRRSFVYLLTLTSTGNARIWHRISRYAMQPQKELYSVVNSRA